MFLPSLLSLHLFLECFSHLCLFSLSLIHGFLVVLLTCAISWIPINFDNATDFQTFLFKAAEHFPPGQNQGRLLCAVCLACETCKQNSREHSLSTTGRRTYTQNYSLALLTIMSNAAVNTPVQGSICVCVFFFSWVYTCKNGIASNCFNFLRNCCAAFPSGYTILHFHQ